MATSPSGDHEQKRKSSASSDETIYPETEGSLGYTQTWKLAAIFAISDPLRPEAVSVISALKKRGIDVWMLSGDNPITANAVGAQVGIPSSNIIAGVLPDQKAEKIKYLQRTLIKSSRSVFRIPFLHRLGSRKTKRATVAMVGDGINDAPALSAADLSIAIGSGSDIALSASSFILITSHF
jgi:Cu+-exporting ATPase